jgi:hypothetical protein
MLVAVGCIWRVALVVGVEWFRQAESCGRERGLDSRKVLFDDCLLRVQCVTELLKKLSTVERAGYCQVAPEPC